jgi:hypothetical protein
VEAQDGMGHRGEITVDTLKTSLDADDKNASASTAFRIVLGLSLILNIFALYGFMIRKRFSKR